MPTFIKHYREDLIEKKSTQKFETFKTESESLIKKRCQSSLSKTPKINFRARETIKRI